MGFFLIFRVLKMTTNTCATGKEKENDTDFLLSNDIQLHLESKSV